MIDISIKPGTNLIYTVAEKKVKEEDYKKLIPQLNLVLHKFKKIRWFFEMKNFSGWEPLALWEDLKFDVKHAKDFEKIAMVGEKKWQNWLSQLMKPFTSAEVKYFNENEKVKAVEWIEDNKF